MKILFVLVFLSFVCRASAVSSVTVLNATEAVVYVSAVSSSSSNLLQPIAPRGQRIFSALGAVSWTVVARDADTAPFAFETSWTEATSSGQDWLITLAPTVGSAAPIWFASGQAEAGDGAKSTATIWAFVSGIVVGTSLFIWQLTKQTFEEVL